MTPKHNKESAASSIAGTAGCEQQVQREERQVKFSIATRKTL
jgi:hypothetical protein